jgi:hypothetical protein
MRATARARASLAHAGDTPNHTIEELVAVVVILDLMHELGLPAERQPAIVREDPQMRRTASLEGEWLSELTS